MTAGPVVSHIRYQRMTLKLMGIKIFFPCGFGIDLLNSSSPAHLCNLMWPFIVIEHYGTMVLNIIFFQL